MIITAPIPRAVTPDWSAAASQAPPLEAAPGTTWSALPRDMLDGGELVLLAVKPSMWRPLFDSLPWLITCVVLLVGLSRLGVSVWGIAPGTAIQAIVLLAFVRLGIALLRWVPTWYVLTNRRVLHVRGARTPRIDSLLLVDIRNTYLHATPTERLTRLATVTLVSRHDNRPMQIWQSLSNPEEVHTRIRRAIENAIDQHDAFG